MPNENQILRSILNKLINTYSTSISFPIPSRNSFPPGKDAYSLFPLFLFLKHWLHSYIIEESAINTDISSKRKYALSDAVRFLKTVEDMINTLYSPTRSSFVGPRYVNHWTRLRGALSMDRFYHHPLPLIMATFNCVYVCKASSHDSLSSAEQTIITGPRIRLLA